MFWAPRNVNLWVCAFLWCFFVYICCQKGSWKLLKHFVEKIKRSLFQLRKDGDEIQSISTVYFKVVVFVKWKQLPQTPLAWVPPQAPCLNLFLKLKYPFRDLERQQRKVLDTRFQLKVSLPINASFSKFKVAIQLKTQNFQVPITAWSAWYLNRLECKVWYKSVNKYDKHKHLGAYST